ncbi:peptidoglycan DD-metalloendopeptidase family protein [Winogradskyella alexanderae]|uniref:Peptidoglycan DD-metalloendopeptidase family protein n=1 Tax=Winogradskyella alexanderae TaxID=2877123 RepID=A0ABS7XRX3_9FLAO|nr:peptidoglycan DD-metalloendopeptidase family protein [Winogradskyella alexanderae]MCA0132760.1 peptidoglycan DD-metalloendopeptidase family protein [Winogradskyella alexanderae]
MKNFTLLFIALVCILNAHSQDNLSNKSLKIKLPIPSFNKINDVHEIEIPIVKKETVISPRFDIKSEYWDTTVYNPYKDYVIAYPFKIEFEDSLYASPINKAKVITSRYGWRRGRPHKGIDIDLVTGDSVVSMLDGIVRFARYSRGHGRTVVVRHYNGLETTYAHLSHIAVKANDSVVKGQYLGKGGNTGNSRGSHLHLVTSFKGENIHPEYLFDFSEDNKIRSGELWVTRKWTRARYHNSRRPSKLALFKSEEEARKSLIKQTKVYIVRRGDTLSRISKRNNITIASICKTNAIRRNSTLRIGQKLVLEL